MITETHFARAADGTHVAYQVTGDGPPDLVLLRGWIGDSGHEWEDPVLARVLRRLGASGRLLRLDRRGMGMSDRVTHRPPPTLEERLDDIRAVLDRAGSDRAILIGLANGTPLCAAFAATYPQRTKGLVLYAPRARLRWAADYPWGRTDEQIEARLEALRDGWGKAEYAAYWAQTGAPSRASDERFVAWLLEQQLRAGSAEDAVALARLTQDTDITPVLGAIHVPTLVLVRSQTAGTAEARHVAERIAGARLVEVRGKDEMLIAGDTDAVLREIEAFVEGIAAHEGEDPDERRVLATLLFTDVVASTEKALELGDRAWADLLERHQHGAAGQVVQFRGRVVDTVGDGLLASFDGPGRAIRCGLSLVAEAAQLGIKLRAGLHTGECELVDGRLRGVAVHIGARVAALARPSEVLVSGTVKDLVAGAGFRFVDRGRHELRGVPGEWPTYSVGGVG